MRFDYVSPTQVTLKPFNGNTVMIGDTLHTVPALFASNAGLAADTTYNAYLALNRAPVIEFSTDGHETDAKTGVQVKLGDFARTLIGKVRTNSSGQFQPDVNTLSWFNRRLKTANAHYTVDGRQTGFASDSGVYVEMHQEIRVPFLSWGHESILLNANGSVSNDCRGHTTRTAIGLDGAPLPEARCDVGIADVAGIGGFFVPLGLSLPTKNPPSEGYHFVTLLGNVSTGADVGRPGEASVGMWAGNYPDGDYCVLAVTVMG